MVERYFEYGRTEIDFLKAKDSCLARVIEHIGHIRRPVNPDMFLALINSIIGQQISMKAQETVWRRFCEKFEPLTPQNIAALAIEHLQSCGISTRKATYIQQIAQSIVEGSLDLGALNNMTDRQICARLSQINGIGVWTAEMLMIFSMRRPDILSWGDMAILRGLRMVYRHRKITPKLFAKYKRRYSPYGSVASLYLWSVAGGACESLGFVDLAAKK